MCLIIFAHRAVSAHPLVVAANRDEFYFRPTAFADFWADTTGPQPVLAGRDLQAGGTWLGINRAGRFAAVTNIRDPSQPAVKPRSRGELTLGFLQSELAASDYAAGLEPSLEQFAGFNLILGDGRDMYYVNNFEAIIQKLEPGVYGLSNGALNSDWPKVVRGREKLEALILAPEQLRTDSLTAMMCDTSTAEDCELPQTGIPIELERVLSAAFIQNQQRDYGTRCSTAVIMESCGRVRFSEQNFDANGSVDCNRYFEFSAREPLIYVGS